MKIEIDTERRVVILDGVKMHIPQGMRSFTGRTCGHGYVMNWQVSLAVADEQREEGETGG